mgnify:CR=1 FL=1
MKMTKKNKVTIIMGDFKEKFGRGRVSNVVGEHGLETRNQRRERLIRFCQEKKLLISNTFFF